MLNPHMTSSLEKSKYTPVPASHPKCNKNNERYLN